MQCAGERRRRACGVQNPVVIITTRDRKLCVRPLQSVTDTSGAREVEWRTADSAKLACGDQRIVNRQEALGANLELVAKDRALACKIEIRVVRQVHDGG